MPVCNSSSDVMGVSLSCRKEINPFNATQQHICMQALSNIHFREVTIMTHFNMKVFFKLFIPFVMLQRETTTCIGLIQMCPFCLFISCLSFFKNNVNNTKAFFSLFFLLLFFYINSSVLYLFLEIFFLFF